MTASIFSVLCSYLILSSEGRTVQSICSSCKLQNSLPSFRDDKYSWYIKSAFILKILCMTVGSRKKTLFFWKYNELFYRACCLPRATGCYTIVHPQFHFTAAAFLMTIHLLIVEKTLQLWEVMCKQITVVTNMFSTSSFAWNVPVYLLIAVAVVEQEQLGYTGSLYFQHHGQWH